MISIVMPYWERREALLMSLKNLRDVYAGTGLEVEIVVVDDGSPNEPAVIPEYLLRGWDVKTLLLQLPRKEGPLNPCVPINVGVASTLGDVIVLTNPEIEHRSAVLVEMLGLLDGPDTYVTARCHDDRLGWLAGPEVDYSRGGRLPVPPGAHFHFCAMLNRSLWQRAGGFDNGYRFGQACDDNDWVWRLAAAGARFRCTEGVVHHQSGTRLNWGIPHNRWLFEQKWPAARRAELGG